MHLGDVCADQLAVHLHKDSLIMGRGQAGQASNQPTAMQISEKLVVGAILLTAGAAEGIYVTEKQSTE